MGAAALLAALLVGCGGGTSKSENSGPPATPDDANGATVTGSVVFTGFRPEVKTIDMSAVPACANTHKTPALSEAIVINSNGTLKNAFVWVKAGLPAGRKWKVPETLVTLTQVGCLYQPHVAGVMTGQMLAIRNEDPANHNIHPIPKVNPDWNYTQSAGSSDKIQRFALEEVLLPIKCNIHPWMQAYVGVVSHPFFAVTGYDGSYTLHGLPPGTYTIEVVHETYGASEQQITVKAKEIRTLDFTVKG